MNLTIFTVFKSDYFTIYNTDYMIHTTWYRLYDNGYMILTIWYWLYDTDYMIMAIWYWLYDTGYMIQTIWYRLYDTDYFHSIGQYSHPDIHTGRLLTKSPHSSRHFDKQLRYKDPPRLLDKIKSYRGFGNILQLVLTKFQEITRTSSGLHLKTKDIFCLIDKWGAQSLWLYNSYIFFRI